MKHYLIVNEDSSISRITGDLRDELFEAWDAGIIDILDITDPSKPLQYNDGEWEPVDLYEI